VAASQLNDVAATTGGLAIGRRLPITTSCPFLQCSTPSLQWPETRTASLMMKEGGTAVLLSSDWFPRQVRNPWARSLASGGFAFQNLFLSLAHLGRRLMMNLHRLKVAAALFGAAMTVTAAHAATFTGSSADITDFAGGSEVSTAGTLIDAVNLLNDNVGGVGVSTTINGVLFKGTQPGQFHEGAEPFADASFVYHGGSPYSDPNLWSSGGAYGTLADSQIYDMDNPNANTGDGYGVVNLTPGTLYQLQVFMLDDRSGVSKTFPLQFQQVKWAGSADNIDNSSPATEIGYMSGITIGGNGVTQANGEIATVIFTIDAPYNGLLVNTWDNGAFNGMQLRQVPEPTTLALCGMVGLAMIWRRSRAR
jgi:PEP-CTERM motif